MKLIAIYEILAGIVGLATTFTLSIGALFFVHSPAMLLIPAILLAAPVLSIAGGYMMLRDRPRGVMVSRIAQVLQLPVLTTSYLTYKLGFGLFFSMAAGLGAASAGTARIATSVEYHLGAAFQLTTHFPPQPVAQSLFGINFVALVLLILLWRVKKNIPAT